MFSFEWEELEAALETLAASQVQRERVRSFVHGIAKRVEQKTLPHGEALMLICTAAHFVMRLDHKEAAAQSGKLSLLH